MLLRIESGPDGTRVTDDVGPAAVTVTADPRTVVGLVTGRLTPAAARRDRTVRIEGDSTALDHLPALFDVGPAESPLATPRSPLG